MFEPFKEFTFRASTLNMIDEANEIINEYTKEGLSLTLRQLYYQFVARGLLPNNQKSYHKLGKTISDGRLAGLISWNAIIDRTRNLQRWNSWNTPADIISSAAYSYALDLWEGQFHRIEVWIEKEALVGVIEQICKKMNIPFFACRGYVSQSEQWAAGKRFEKYFDNGQFPVVIHLGDHDPSGIDMTRDIDDRLAMFAYRPVEIRRIALNYNQIEEYNPPPNPAKMTDTRADKYISQFGYQSWELDALEPKVMRDLIQSTVMEYCDKALFEEKKAQQERERKKLRLLSDQWDEISKDL